MLARVYRRYCKLPVCNDRWEGFEREAKLAKLGLRGDSKHIPPLDFRRQKRKKAGPLVFLNAN